LAVSTDDVEEAPVLATDDPPSLEEGFLSGDNDKGESSVDKIVEGETAVAGDEVDDEATPPAEAAVASRSFALPFPLSKPGEQYPLVVKKSQTSTIEGGVDGYKSIGPVSLKNTISVEETISPSALDSVVDGKAEAEALLDPLCVRWRGMGGPPPYQEKSASQAS